MRCHLMSGSKVATAEARRFMIDCLKAAGAASKPAFQHADLLIEADRLGHPSHGLNRLEMYVNDILNGTCSPNNQPMVLRESAAIAWVDANNVLGSTASHFGMDLAICKAAQSGIGWVAVRGSNHNGMLGYWAKKAANMGMIGMACTNSSPLMAPTRSKQSALGTNPLAVAAPGNDGDIFYIDMATTTVSFGKIEMKRRRKEPLLPGWAQGPDGKQTLDAELAAKTACLMPLGGSEETSGYKGFGLAAMVEIFTGMLSGSNYAHTIRGWRDTGKPRPANLGHCFFAINPQCFGPCFQDRMSECMRHWRNLEPTDVLKPVLAPGDLERNNGRETDAKGTVSYVPDQVRASAALAKKLKFSVSVIMGKVATSDALRFMKDCFKAVGAGVKPARQQAELLIAADMYGVMSCGINSLQTYLTDIESGICCPNNIPRILKETASTAWVNGNNTLGATSSHFAMNMAICKACQTGVGWVAVKGANHNGMNAYWSKMAADKGMIGLNFSNSSPLMAPTRSKKAALGNNPLSVVAHGCCGELFFLHMATTAVALGKIEAQGRLGKPLIPGWAQGPDGNETLDAEVAAKTLCIMPLGGREESGGYKGYGLAAMVEVFSGILADSDYGHHIRPLVQDSSKKPEPANLGHSFAAVNPCFFAPGFSIRLTDCMQHWRQLDPVVPDKHVMCPGDSELQTYCQASADGAVTYVEDQIKASEALAQKFNVKPLSVTKGTSK